MVQAREDCLLGWGAQLSSQELHASDAAVGAGGGMHKGMLSVSVSKTRTAQSNCHAQLKPSCHAEAGVAKTVIQPQLNLWVCMLVPYPAACDAQQCECLPPQCVCVFVDAAASRAYTLLSLLYS